MDDITRHEMGFVLKVAKNISYTYNANSISKELGISSMGAFKIAKRLLAQDVIKPKKFGRAKFFALKWENEYAKKYTEFLLRKEAEHSSIKMWVNEARKIKNADAAVIFGSILKKDNQANDIDILIITDQKRYKAAKQELESINIINQKKIHPVFQTPEDLQKNMQKPDKAIIAALNGIVAFGEEKIIGLLQWDTPKTNSNGA